MAGRRRVLWLRIGAMLLALCVPASALAAPISPTGPTVSLDSPGNGSVVTTSEPTFSGTAGSPLPTSSVTVHVFAGAVASGPDVASLTTTRDPASGNYSVTAGSPLPDGTYTAQAQQVDPTGTGSSASTTFTVNATAPHVVLHSPGPGPLSIATPTLTGTARTLDGDEHSIALAIFAGSEAAGTPVRFLTGPVNASGGFSIPVAPGLRDGQYTAVAGQKGAASSSLSNPVTFRIKVHPSALTLTDPAPGASVVTRQPTFVGAAGTDPGDAGSVAVTLHAGGSAIGRDLGHHTVPVGGGRWMIRWPNRLALGVYTLVIVQGDDAGHTTTVITTFGVVPAPQAIGPRVTLSGSHAAVQIACTAPSGTSCRGDVLVVTTRPLQARAGGPVGPVRLLFAYVVIPAGLTRSVSGSLPDYIVGALRRERRLEVRVTVNFASLGRHSAIRTVS